MENEASKIITKKNSFNWKSKKAIFVYILVALAVLATGLYFFLFQNSFSKEDIVVQVTAPKEASNGENITWILAVRNNSNIKLTNIKVSFVYPQGTFNDKAEIKKMENVVIEEILPGQEVTKNFSGILLGKKNENKEVKANLIYSPQDFTAEFQTEATASTLITNSLILFSSKIPDKVDKKEQFTISLSWQSEFASPLENVQVRVTLPKGFVRTSEMNENERRDLDTRNEQEATGQDRVIFDVGTLNEGEGQKIEIKGKLVGDVGDQKMFKAEIGKFDDKLYEFIPFALTEKSVKIVSSNINIFRKVNGESEYFASPGEKLSYIITFKNAGEDVYQNLSLNVKLDSSILDLSTLKSQGGKVIGDQIIYTSKEVPELLFLGPYDEGSVGFSVNVKNGILPQNSYINEIINVDTVKKSFKTKIGSNSSLNQHAYFNLPGSLIGKIKTSGKFPLAQNKETVLVGYWELENRGNQLKNAKITFNLPENVTWTGNVYPKNALFVFDKTTKKVRLDIGNISYNFSKKYAFQIKIKPSVLPQDLILNTKLSAIDVWTGQSFEVMSPNLATDSVQ
jgi:uncharacterized repeat protein (TIGR01451 family)